MNECDEKDGWSAERTGRLSPHHESMTSAEYVVRVCVFDASITITVARWFPFPRRVRGVVVHAMHIQLERFLKFKSL